ncbi:hypothetical protein [Vibrio fluvialis]|nr:hypothetical protein [Vibrio fluvialis]
MLSMVKIHALSKEIAVLLGRIDLMLMGFVGEIPEFSSFYHAV